MVIRRVLLAAVVAIVVACAKPGVSVPQPSSPVILAVVTWNMHAGKGDLPRLVDDLSAGRLTGIPSRDYVLLLQEAIAGGPHDVEALARTRTLYAFYSAVRRTSAGISGNAIVSTRPLVEPHAIDLPRVRQPRAAIATRISIAGTDLFLLNAHLENRVTWLRGGLLADIARGRQADAILRAIPPGPAIAGGDFNTWLGPTEPAWKKLAARFPDTREPMQPTFHDRLILDHLFVDVPVGWTVTQMVAREAYHSDHHPVVALLRPDDASAVHRAP
jgi:endonuclease/exonuclease/phosphatase family metal-dependent hydrolase